MDSDGDAGGRGQDVSSWQQRWKERCRSTAAGRKIFTSGEGRSATLPLWSMEVRSASAAVVAAVRAARGMFLTSMQLLSRPVAENVEFRITGRAAHQSGQHLSNWCLQWTEWSQLTSVAWYKPQDARQKDPTGHRWVKTTRYNHKAT